MTEYAGRQFVGIDLHRRRSVIARTTGDGELLQAVQIVNDVESLNAVVALAGEDPEVTTWRSTPRSLPCWTARGTMGPTPS